MAELIGAIRDYNAAIATGLRNKIDVANNKLTDVVSRMINGYHNNQKLYALMTR